MPPVCRLAPEGKSVLRPEVSTTVVRAASVPWVASNRSFLAGVVLGVASMTVTLPAFAGGETALDQAGETSQGTGSGFAGSSQGGVEGAATSGAAGQGQSGSEFTTSSGSESHASGMRHPLVLAEPNPPPDPKAYTLTLSGGASWYDSTRDNSICKVVSQLGPTTPSFRMQLGRQWLNQIQLQLDLGVINDQVESCSKDTGEGAGEITAFQKFTLGLGVGYRFDYLDEQPLVPYLNVGLDGSLIPLSTSASFEDELGSSSVGYRLGAYAGGGLEILLDTFSPTRAADLELSSGINDTFLVLDARYIWEGRYIQDMALATEDRLVFYGWQVTAGLKLDF